MSEKKTNFGFEQVGFKEKTEKVKEVFQSVAPRYDLMNDLMSFGIHRLWKKKAISVLNVHPEHRVLDLAGGTGDLTSLILEKTKRQAKVILSDINEAMLEEGRCRLINEGILDSVEYVLANAEKLPFPDHYFDRVIIGFGLRNVTEKEKAIAEIFRVLKMGGKMLILEFSHPTSPLVQKLYDLYSFQIIPKIGALVANDEASYQYLAESIRMHPNQENLLAMIQQQGFFNAGFENLNQGIVALHWGFKC